MQLGPIGIAGDLDQPEPPRHDYIEALTKRRRRGLRSNVSAFAAHVMLRVAVMKFSCHDRATALP
jgi:N-acyl-D-aspartate/D-glutamate deacylase